MAKAAVAVGLPDVALRHALRCVELVESHAEVMADWDAPFAQEALARALAGTGEGSGAADALARCLELADAVADPGDRAVIDTELARPPWFGLR